MTDASRSSDDAAASLSSGLGSSSASAAAGAPQRRSPYPGRKRRWAVILYFLTTTLLFADQNLLAPNLSAAAAEFGFDDEERDRKLGGNIALAFWVAAWIGMLLRWVFWALMR